MTRNLYNELDKMVQKAFAERLTPSKKSSTITPSALYESIEDYKMKTGKRFRQTKADKEAGLTREESFEKMYGTQTDQDQSGRG